MSIPARKKISVFSRRFEGVEIKFHICVDCNGRFSIALPTKVVAKMECDELVYGDTKRQVEQAFTKVLVEYEDTKFTVTKVIIYRFMCSLHSQEKQIFRHDLGHDVAIGMGLDWATCNKLEHPGRRTAYRTDADKHVNVDMYGRDSDHKEMLWTQEKEDFFKVLEASLENSIARAVKFFDGPVEQCIVAHSGLAQLGFDGDKK
jgi:hypothetical protein